MDDSVDKTAVLYFTRSAGEEAQEKLFCNDGNYARNRAIAQTLISHTYEQIQASGLPIEICTSDAQRGRTFGEKLAHAYQDLFDKGYENVIAVGNDCIQLSAEILLNAAHLLERKSLVIGPAVDGGAYLIGIKREAFYKDFFIDLSWETAGLFDDFKRYAGYYDLALAQLGCFFDIDDEKELRVFIKYYSSIGAYFHLILLLQNILQASAVVYYSYLFPLLFLNCHFCFNYRGPPA